MLFNPPEISRKKETDQIEQTGQKSRSSSTTYYGPATWISQSCSQCIVFTSAKCLNKNNNNNTSGKKENFRKTSATKVSVSSSPFASYASSSTSFLPSYDNLLLVLQRFFSPPSPLHFEIVIWLSLLEICLKVCLLNSSKK